MNSVQCDGNGTIVGFPYHDGSLDGVLREERVLKLALRSVDGVRRVLALSGVRRFAMDDFWEGNIVLTLGLAPVGRECWVTAAVEAKAFDKWGLELARVPRELLCFVLSSSYGVHIVAICEEVTLSDPGVGLSATKMG